VLTIRPTKKLAKRLGIEVPAVAPVVTNRVADWCAHEFTVARYRYLLFINTASLLPALTYARGVRDDHTLLVRLLDTVRAVTEGTKGEKQYRRWIGPASGVVQFAPIPGPSIMGSINEMVRLAKGDLERDEWGPVDIAQRMAEAPMGMLGMNNPARVFPTLGG